MATRIEPSVGRVLWFWRGGRRRMVEGLQPEAAMIAKVNGDGSLNIGWLDGESGVWKSAVGVRLWQPADGAEEPPEGNFCAWMPYQLGQAALAQSREEKLREAARQLTELQAKSAVPADEESSKEPEVPLPEPPAPEQAAGEVREMVEGKPAPTVKVGDRVPGTGE